jgi:hypothetical protein
MAYLSRKAAHLYFFPSAVADRHGMSFYANATVVTQQHMTVIALTQACEELLGGDLVAHEVHSTQALSMPPSVMHHRRKPDGRLMQLGKILRRAAELSPSNHPGACQ